MGLWYLFMMKYRLLYTGMHPRRNYETADPHLTTAKFGDP
jgi:hypothetical protein